ncbi:MAG: glycine oxidase ThiO, partial [Vicinamibacterales bacterium]
MTGGQDVVVIGAGVIGCSVARELARRGASVRMFEARTVGAGATQASAGILAPYIEGHDRGTLFDLGLRSLGLYDAFVRAVSEESGLTIEYRRCGTLEVATDGATASRLRHASETEPVLRWLDAPSARAHEPALAESIEGALLVRDHGYVAVPALLDGLAWAALRHGVQIEAAHRVTGIRADDTGVTISTEDGTSWSAGQAVIAAGSWTGWLDVDDPAAAAVRPIRGQLLRLHWRGAPLNHIVWGPDCYVVPWQEDIVLVGATVEDVGFDEHTTAAGVRDLLDAVCELLPEAWRATFLEARVGLRPATPDALPLLGPSARSARIIYATG